MLTNVSGREEATQESDFTFDDEHDGIDEGNDWSGEVEWTDRDEGEGPDQDVADESAAYLQFLDQEVSSKLFKIATLVIANIFKAKKFSSMPHADGDELSEESLLETPLDKVEPYMMFKRVLMGMFLQPKIISILLTDHQSLHF